MRTASSKPRRARPQGRPTSHPVGRRQLASLEQASDDRQGPEPQAYTATIVKNDPSSEEKEATCKQQERLKQNDPNLFHLNSEPGHCAYRLFRTRCAVTTQLTIVLL